MNPSDDALDTALEYAEAIHGDGFRRTAAMVLRTALAPYDPGTSCTDPRVMRAAILYAEGTTNDPDSQLGYALFAERNARNRLGLSDPLTLAAMKTLVTVALEQDLTVEAITVCGRLIDAYTIRGDATEALLWRREQAKYRHDDGQCEQALADIVACMDLAAGLPAGDRRLASRRALMRRVVILAGCGDDAAALAVLHQHSELLPSPGSRDRDVEVSTLVGGIRAAAATHPAVCTQAPHREDATPSPHVVWATAIAQVRRP